jgi:hypothetical protein
MRYLQRNKRLCSTLTSQCATSHTAVQSSSALEGKAMKVALAPQYRMWMFALFPATLGIGTAALWLRSLSWPLRVDATGLTLRHHRRVNWQSITKIGVSRSYLDGHVAQLRIHHHGGVNRIPVHGLQDGEKVARTILTMFELAHRPRARKRNMAEPSARSDHWER